MYCDYLWYVFLQYFKNYIYYSRYFLLIVLEVIDLEDEKEEKLVLFIVSLFDFDVKEKNYFVIQLMEVFWVLYSVKFVNLMLVSVCLLGLVYVDVIVGVLVEIIYVFIINDFDNVVLFIKLYVKMLFCFDQQVSFFCKQVMIRCLRFRYRRRRVFIFFFFRCSLLGKNYFELINLCYF